MISITGILDRITFYNDENHYTIAQINLKETKQPVTIVGYMAGLVHGETLKISGKWVNHPKYGDQFKVDFFEVSLPETITGIRNYLGSGIIKGIGNVMAKRIVDHFKEKSLDIIENEPHRLKEIPGIGKSKLSLITRAWDKHHSVRRVMKFLQDNGVTSSHAGEILQLYGKDTLEILKNDPYTVAHDIPGTGFELADAIALNSGIKKNDPQRIRASIIYLLLRHEKNGHVFAEKQDLVSRAAKLTSAMETDIEQALTSLEKNNEIVMDADTDIENSADDTDDAGTRDAEEQCHVYLSRLYRAETGIAARIKAMVSVPVSDYGINRDEIIDEVLTRLAVKLSCQQIDVVTQTLAHRVVIITGGPGTGKTTLIRALCTVFNRLKQKVFLAAPTGRAARRLSEVTSKKASTIHKLLLYDHEKEFFGRNPVNPLDSDVLIVDEASMVDTMLMFHLVEAVPVNSVFILVGDVFQLPSVGPGNVLSDIIQSGAVNTFELTKIFRQAEKSPIVMNAHCIRNGEMPVLKRNSKDNELSEFYFIENTDPEKVVSTITTLCSTSIKRAFPHVDEIQVLTPMHRGEAGTINLNNRLQQALNSRPGGIKVRGGVFKTGDRVMHLKNNYQKEVFNGDIGIIHEVVKSESRLTVDYDGRMVDYDILELDELALAYAISVHKSQGSEYSAVVIAITTMHFPLLQRNLLYTAMTRGRDLVILVGSRRALEIALNNNRTDFRLSGLKRRF